MNLIEVNTPEKEQVRQFYRVNEDSIKEDVERIREWMAKQPHLPKNLTDDFVEKVLVRNKFRVEKSKSKLDNYYTLRGNNRNLIQDFVNVVCSRTYLPMPKLTPQFERIVLLKLTTLDSDQFDIHDIFVVNLAMEELVMKYDYSIGSRYILDLGGWTFKHIIKINPIPMAKHVNFIEQAYSNRILGIEIINSGPLVNKLLSIFKTTFKAKIYEKIRVHEDSKYLHEVVPKQCLPEEYGGTCGTIPEHLKRLDDVMREHKEFFLESCNNVSEEHLRLNKTTEESEFGVDGTFKRLQID